MCPRAYALRNRAGEFLPRKAAAIERPPDGLEQGIGLRWRKPGSRIPVWFMEQGICAQCSHPQRQLVRWEQVQRSTGAIGLDESMSLPECCLHVSPGDSGDSRPDGEFSGREDLRLDAADRTNGVNQPILWQGLKERMAGKPSPACHFPGERSHKDACATV